MKIAWTLGICFIALGWGSILSAQNTGTILGTVKDQSDAVLPGATVTITNTETGITRITVSGSRGEYRAPALVVGTYAVQATASGFQTSIRQGIELSVGREAVVDFQLSVGNVAEQVTITGEAPLIETTTATVSGLVSPEQIKEIPLNGRSFLDLVPLQTGAVFSDNGGTSVTIGFAAKLSIVGTRYNTNSFLLDGSSINDASGSSGSASGTMAGVETVREFRVVTNAYDAEYGNHTGGVISVVTKSGSNNFHGSVFEYLRNDNFDANSWGNNKRSIAPLVVSKNGFARNQFGGTLGGPVIHDRTFFFGSYEGLREALGTTQTDTVPTATLLNGFIPVLKSGLRCAPTATCTGVLPAGSPGFQYTRPTRADGTKGDATTPVAQAVLAILNSYPAPNIIQNSNDPLVADPYERPDGTAQRNRPQTQYTMQNTFTGRADHHLSDSDTIFGRVTVDNSQQYTPEFSDVSWTTAFDRYFTVEETHIISPAVLARTNVAFNRTAIRQFTDPKADFPFPKFTLPNGQPMPGGPGSLDGTNNLGSTGGLGLGLSTWGGVDPKRSVLNLYQVKEDLYITKGRHSVKFGGQMEHFQFNHQSDFNSGGSYTFASKEDGLAGRSSLFDTIKPGSDNIRGWRQTLLGLYLQDDLQVRPGLTLNAGLRYEAISMPTEVNGKMANIRDITPQHLAVVDEKSTDVGAPFIKNPSRLNFAPRIGIAWSPFRSGKTSVRAGAGKFFEQIQSPLYQNPGIRAQPFFAIAEIIASRTGTPADFPYAYFTQRDAIVNNLGSSPQIDGIEWDAKQPTVYKWSLDLSQQLSGSTTFEIGYSGTRALHLLRGNLILSPSPAVMLDSNLNPDPAGRRFIELSTDGQTQAPVIAQNWGRVRWRIWDGTSIYHGLRTQVTKRLGGGMQIQGSYTFSKSIDDGSAFLGSGDFNGDIQPYGTSKLRTLSSFDVRHAFTTNFVYDLPLAKNKKGVVGGVLGGWGVSGVLKMFSGPPQTLTATRPQYSPPGGAAALTFLNTNGMTVDMKPNGKIVYHRDNPDMFYDVSLTSDGSSYTQFAWPAANCITTTPAYPVCDKSKPIGAFEGDVTGNTLIGPGKASLDFTLTKDTKLPMIGESGNLQFRAEAFNLTNHPNFSPPGVNLFDRNGVPVSRTNTGGPGVITGTPTGSERELQFALRLSF